MIKIEDMSVIYQPDIKALDHINLSLDSKHYTIVGQNGSGKSTFLQSLVGIVEHSGSIIIDDLEVKKEHLVDIRKKVGLVFQNPDHQLFMATIYDDLAFGLINQKMPKDKIDQKIKDIASRFHIESLLHRSAHQLSEGQKRMVAILTVLIMEPDIILMDEPSSFLDPKSRRQLIHLIQDIDKTLIISTHDLDMALEISDEVILLNEGKVVIQDEKDLVLTNQSLLEENGLELPYCLSR